MLEEEIHFAFSGTRIIYVTHDGVHTMQGFTFFCIPKKKQSKKINVKVREGQNNHISHTLLMSNYHTHSIWTKYICNNDVIYVKMM